MRVLNRCWPSAQHQLLLKTILADEAHLQTAWAEWKQSIDIQDLDYAAQRLLPLLYNRLRRSQITDPQIDLIKGVCRFTSAKNIVLFAPIERLLATLQERGIDTLLLKGAALTCAYYRDLSLRPMIDIDVLVPSHQVVAAMNILEELHYQHRDPEQFVARKRPEFRTVAHAQSFFSPIGQEIDLHWNIAPECCGVDEGSHFWERSLPIEFKGIKSRTLDPTDQLFHVCLHGSKWCQTAPIRWIADAAVVLAHSSIDWDRILTHATTYRVIPHMQDSLACLSDCFNLPIPSPFLTQLKALKPSKFERKEYLSLTTEIDRFHRAIRRHWYRHALLSQSKNFFSRLFSFPRFFQYHWTLPSLGQISRRALKILFFRYVCSKK
jgi:hypothetical protein